RNSGGHLRERRSTARISFASLYLSTQPLRQCQERSNDFGIIERSQAFAILWRHPAARRGKSRRDFPHLFENRSVKLYRAPPTILEECCHVGDLLRRLATMPV